MEKIRVLQIGMYNGIGGIETYIMNYYRNINKNKIQFDFINMYENLYFEDEIHSLGGKIYKVTNVKKRIFKFCKELYKIIKESDYEIVHINMLSAANILPVIVAKIAKVPNIIVHSHNANIPKGILRKFLHFLNKKILINSANHFFACSDQAGKWLFGKDKKYIIINNAIDINKFKYNKTVREKIRNNLGIDNKLVIGHVGRFAEQKNHKYLIEVLKEVIKINEDVVLLLIGTGELEDSIREQINNNSLQRNVIFLGVKQNVYEYYQAMDVFVLTSIFEGLPVVGIEAQANSLPCIFSNNITKELKCSKNVRFININKEDIPVWRDSILDIKNKQRIIDLKEINNKYSIVNETKKLEKLYERMMRNIK